MPNGIMKGSGTRENPFIVEDGWDLDALRNLSATEWHWIELANNIDLRMFPNWTPIPSRRLNINGCGYTIQGLRITGGSGHIGLFTRLETLETKDLIIEAEIVQPSSSTNSVGILCGQLVGGAFGTSDTTTRTATLSNIQCFGSISVTVTGATQATGGCFGSSWGESDVTLNIFNCAFHGSISYHITASSTTSPSSSQLRACGGIMGFADARSGISNYSIHMVNCISVAQFTMLGGTAHAIVGGILGAARAGTAPNITNCVAKNRLAITNPHNWTQTIWFGGIVGAGIVACNISFCAAHSQVIYSPSADVATLHIAGIHCMRSTGTSPVSTSYAVIEFQNPTSANLPATRSMRGIGGQVVVTNSFFDADVLAIGWTEAVTNAELGRTTAQLQSRDFLELQGWVFVDG